MATHPSALAHAVAFLPMANDSEEFAYGARFLDQPLWDHVKILNFKKFNEFYAHGNCEL